MKNIIINVDDLGLSHAVNQAVVDLAEKKRITATSYMVGGMISDEHKQALKELNVEIGLHIDFTGIFESPLTTKLTSVLFKAYTRQLNKNKVMDNIKQQFDLFEDIFGHVPVHVDGHQHVHQFPIIRHALMNEIVQRSSYGEIKTRITKPLINDVKSHIIYLLGGQKWQNMCHKNSVATNTGFCGVYGFDKSLVELARLWEKWITACEPGNHKVNLIMCHPAKPLIGNDNSWNDEIKTARETEYLFLMSDDFGALLNKLAT